MEAEPRAKKPWNSSFGENQARKRGLAHLNNGGRMRTLAVSQWKRIPAAAPAFIALGLGILIVFGKSPAPVLTALGLITLGATLATIDRFNKSPALPFVLVLHTLTYGCLAALFLGALLHSANPFALIHVIDITSGSALILIAAQRAMAASRTHSGLSR
jgi:hypothetical protein